MKPILFNTDMVRAILEGRKTVTRRVIKPQPRFIYANDNFGPLMQITKPHKGVWFKGDPNHVAPYHPGDVLYVRETWQQNYDGTYTYRAGDKFEWEKGWRPSIHMPREAARLFLRVTAVRVERLQDITEEQARREGFSSGAQPITSGPWGVEDDPGEWTAIESFSEIWDSIIKPKDLYLHGWAANPWVWVIEFERITKEATAQ